MQNMEFEYEIFIPIRLFANCIITRTWTASRMLK